MQGRQKGGVLGRYPMPGEGSWSICSFNPNLDNATDHDLRQEGHLSCSLYILFPHANLQSLRDDNDEFEASFLKNKENPYANLMLKEKRTAGS